MGYKIGIDVGGTFTDFLLVTPDGKNEIYKVLNTPEDPSISTMKGISEMAEKRGLSTSEFLNQVDVIVHGTTVTTNAVLTYTGVKTGLLTTEGVRDALEMRRGIREEQYNNRYKNARPVVERYLRLPVKERVDYSGKVITPLDKEQTKSQIEKLKKEDVKAVAICFMHSYANDIHEKEVYNLVKDMLPDVYITLSAELLPSVRFYDRISTTCLNSYVGPILEKYLKALIKKLSENNFKGVLLIMASNGGVVSPENAMERAAVTLLSGPAGGPVAGTFYANAQKYTSCLIIDMGGTSFDASVVKDNQPTTTTTGDINRLRIALPMLNVVTIGAGGGSIGWIDEGGLLRMGPQSASSNPGPVCYDLGGEEPTCTDADLILGYLDPDYFAGGKIKLNKPKAEKAIVEKIAKPLKYDLYEAAAGMYNVINVNMAAAVREVAVKEGVDPRDLPMIVGGGAGPNHACMIAKELEIPVMIVPRESSILCAAGMLMSDLKHDFVQSYVTRMDMADIKKFKNYFIQMKEEGAKLLKSEGIPENNMKFIYQLDLRYVRQYHEVTVEIPEQEILEANWDAIAKRFHPQHNKLFGYSLEEEGTPIEIINLRLIAVGQTDKPKFLKMEYKGENPEKAFKNRRKVFLPVQQKFEEVNVFDALKLEFGNRIEGPAILEQDTTTTFVTSEYNVMVDCYGNYTIYLKDREEEVRKRILGS